jgi:hypothetical protein
MPPEELKKLIGELQGKDKPGVEDKSPPPANVNESELGSPEEDIFEKVEKTIQDLDAMGAFHEPETTVVEPSEHDIPQPASSDDSEDSPQWTEEEVAQMEAEADPKEKHLQKLAEQEQNPDPVEPENEPDKDPAEDDADKDEKAEDGEDSNQEGESEEDNEGDEGTPTTQPHDPVVTDGKPVLGKGKWGKPDKGDIDPDPSKEGMGSSGPIGPNYGSSTGAGVTDPPEFKEGGGPKAGSGPPPPDPVLQPHPPEIDNNPPAQPADPGIPPPNPHASFGGMSGGTVGGLGLGGALSEGLGDKGSSNPMKDLNKLLKEPIQPFDPKILNKE